MDEPSSRDAETSEVARARRRSFRLPEEIGVIVALLVMIVVIGVARPRFLNPINLLTILGNTTFQGMMSLGMVFLLAIREIDLSVGWMFNFSAVVAALMMVAESIPGLPRWEASASALFWASSTACWPSACGCRRSS